MIAHLRGKLIHKEPGQAIVEAGGVGYDVAISVPTFTALPSLGAEAALHIHTQVSDDQIAPIVAGSGQRGHPRNRTQCRRAPSATMGGLRSFGPIGPFP